MQRGDWHSVYTQHKPWPYDIFFDFWPLKCSRSFCCFMAVKFLLSCYSDQGSSFNILDKTVNQRCFGFPQTNMPKNQHLGGEAAPHRHSHQKEGPSWLSLPSSVFTVMASARLPLCITLFFHAALFFLLLLRMIDYEQGCYEHSLHVFWWIRLCVSIGHVARRGIPKSLFTVLLGTDLTVSSAPTATCHGGS